MGPEGSLIRLRPQHYDKLSWSHDVENVGDGGFILGSSEETESTVKSKWKRDSEWAIMWETVNPLPRFYWSSLSHFGEFVFAHSRTHSHTHLFCVLFSFSIFSPLTLKRNMHRMLVLRLSHFGKINDGGRAVMLKRKRQRSDPKACGLAIRPRSICKHYGLICNNKKADHRRLSLEKREIVGDFIRFSWFSNSTLLYNNITLF